MVKARRSSNKDTKTTYIIGCDFSESGTMSLDFLGEDGVLGEDEFLGEAELLLGEYFGDFDIFGDSPAVGSSLADLRVTTIVLKT